MEINNYLAEILSQPSSLKKSILQFEPSSLEPLSRSLRNGDFDRVILTGMGASYYSLFPASLILGKCGLPVMTIDTAELIHYGLDLLSPRSLVWAVSQSGQSAEIISLLDIIKDIHPKGFLATVNDQRSPLAEAASIIIPLSTEPEQTVSTRTYLNSLALMQLAALSILDGEPTNSYDELMRFSDILQIYLNDWEKNLEQIASVVDKPTYLALVGRGPSLASVFAGTLVLEEAAKFPAMGFQAAQFRHGPLEMTNQEVTVMCFAGSSKTLALNKNLFNDLCKMGVRSIWLEAGVGLSTLFERGDCLDNARLLPLPEGSGICLPLAEIVPIQLLSIHLARAFGFEPGKFLRAKKVTLSE